MLLARHKISLQPCTAERERVSLQPRHYSQPRKDAHQNSKKMSLRSTGAPGGPPKSVRPPKLPSIVQRKTEMIKPRGKAGTIDFDQRIIGELAGKSQPKRPISSLRRIPGLSG